MATLAGAHGSPSLVRVIAEMKADLEALKLFVGALDRGHPDHTASFRFNLINAAAESRTSRAIHEEADAIHQSLPLSSEMANAEAATDEIAASLVLQKRQLSAEISHRQGRASKASVTRGPFF